LINIQWLLFSRASEAFFNGHRQGPMEQILHTYGQFLIKTFFSSVQTIIIKQQKIPNHLVPDKPIPSYLQTLQKTPNKFFSLVNEGKIKGKQGNIKKFLGGKKIELSNGEIIEADLVVAATGYVMELPFLPEKVLKTVLDENGHCQLYRTILPIGIKNLGFIGMQSSLISQLTHEIAAQWLAQYFLGNLKQLPSEPEMKEISKKFLKWQLENFKKTKGNYIGPACYHFVDELLEDMGISKIRRGNFITENLAPMWPTRYKGLKEELEKKMRGEKSAPNYYFSGTHFLIILLFLIFILYMKKDSK